MRKVLVTGGAGFIGNNFVRYWLKEHPEDQVINLDLMTYAGHPANLADLEKNPRHKFVKGNIADKKLVNRLLKGVDFLVHFAAESHNTRAEQNPEIFYQTNVEGTKALLEAAMDSTLTKIISVSTDEVYGSVKEGYLKEEEKPPAETLKADYPKSKSLADDLALGFGKKGLPVIVARPTNNFGPRQFPEKALPRWITNLILGEKIPLWGKGKQIRDWLYVEDTCRAIKLLLEKGKTGEPYNIGANHSPEIENRQAAEWLVETMELPKTMIDFITDPRPHHDFRYGVDTQKIRALGFQPNLDAKKLFHETVLWYKENPAWWKPLKEEAEKIYKRRG